MTDLDFPAVIAPEQVDFWEREVDVVVVGQGVAGTCAALEAHRSGSDVLVVERASGGGGASAMSSGIFYLGGGTAVQQAAAFQSLLRVPICRDTFGFDQFGFEVFQIFIIQLEPPLQRAIGHTAFALEHCADLVQYLVKGHSSPRSRFTLVSIVGQAVDQGLYPPG